MVSVAGSETVPAMAATAAAVTEPGSGLLMRIVGGVWSSQLRRQRATAWAGSAPAVVKKPPPIKRPDG